MGKAESMFVGIGVAILVAVIVNVVERMLGLPHTGYVESALAIGCGLTAANLARAKRP